MYRFVDLQRSQIEAYLLQNQAGYDVWDAMVQANIDVGSLTLEDLRGLVARQAATEGRRRALAGST